MTFKFKSACNPKRKIGVFGSLCLYLLAIAAVVSFFPIAGSVYASEGGSSNYTPGTYGDFAMNVIPSGLSVRENIIYYDGELKKFPVSYSEDLPFSVGVEPDFELDMRFTLLQAVYASDFKILGGRYFANINIPYAFDAELKVSANTLFGDFKFGDDSSGLGDIQFVPFGLAWDIENFHILFGENIVAPTGGYDADELVSIGRNYWGYETILGVTWLHPERGHEVSISLAYMMNAENSETDYKTGDEFHMDYTLAQYFSESFAVGLVGYYYTQTTDDSGSGFEDLEDLFPGIVSSTDDLKGLRADGGGIGPAIMWAPKIGGKPLNIIFKWMNEYACTNRPEGIWYNLSAAMTF